MTRIALVLASLLTAIVMAAGCGSDGSASSSAAGLAPAGSLMYGEVTLKPEGDQRAAIDALVRKFPGEGGAGERVRQLMEKAFTESGSGLSYEKDIEPWLGDEAAFFLSRIGTGGDKGDGALLVATTDEDASRATIAKALDGEKQSTYKDADYVTKSGGAAGVVDGWVVLGTEGGLKAAVDVAAEGRSMDDDEAFQETLADAPGERLGYFYFNSPGFFKELAGTQGGAQLGPFRRFFKEPFLATANADEAGVRFEASVPKSLTAGFPVVAEGSDLAAGLPGDSWLAMAQPDLGKLLEQYVDLVGSALGGTDLIEQQFKATTGLDLREDVIAWMGDWAVFVRGETVADLSGALIVETSDEEASARVIDTIARYARENVDPGEEVRQFDAVEGGEGVTLTTPDVPQPIHLFQRDGKFVLAYGDEAAADAFSPEQKLGDTAEFEQAEEALGDGYAVSFYMAVGPILALADSAGAGSDEEWQKVKPYLEPLGALVGGAREDGEELRSAFGVTVR